MLVRGKDEARAVSLAWAEVPYASANIRVKRDPIILSQPCMPRGSARGPMPRRFCRRLQLVSRPGITGKTTNKFSPELRDGAVRLGSDNEGQRESRWQAAMSISA